MSDTPVRSVTVQTSQAFARQLLDSGRADGPPAEARERALLAFGLAPVGLLVVAPPAAALAPAPGPAGVLAVGTKAVPWVVAKSLAIGLLGSLVAMSVIDRTLDSSARTPAAVPLPSVALTAPAVEPPSPATPSAAAVVPPGPPPASAAATSPQMDVAKPAEASRSPLGAPVSNPSAAAFQDGGLLDLEALAHVRRALSAHEAQRALSLLDDFEKRFPASQVAEEAAVLRIEALRAQGRAREARALGQTFLQARPSSVYASKVRSITQAP